MDNMCRTLLVLCSVIGSLLADTLTEEERIKAVIDENERLPAHDSNSTEPKTGADTSAFAYTDYDRFYNDSGSEDLDPPLEEDFIDTTGLLDNDFYDPYFEHYYNNYVRTTPNTPTTTTYALPDNGLPDWVTSPPRILREVGGEIAYKKDEPVKLYCTATGDPPPSYTWLVNGEELVITGDSIQQVAGEGTINIEHPGPEHEGVYQCKAQNQYGIALTINTVLKRARLESFKTSTSVPIHTPKIGDYLKLECHPPESYPAANIYWGEGNTAIKIKSIENNNRVILDYDGNLHITDIQSKDSLRDSRYVCVVYNHVLRSLVQGDDKRIQPVMLALPKNKAPEIKWHSESPRVVLEGATLKMKCIFSGYPTPNVSWQRQGGETMPASATVSDDGLELVIENIDFNDSGSYACQAENSRRMKNNPITKVMTVDVEAKPRWHTQPESVDTSEEERAEFQCQATGLPKPVISWLRNGVDLESIPNDRRTIFDNGERVVYSSVVEADAAVLQCNASNKHGYIFTNAYLNVLSEEPTWIIHPQPEVKVAEGQDAKLACEVYGAPKPVVTWYKHGDVVQGNRFTIDTKGKIAGNLTIKPSILSDAGKYKCEAVNKFGNISGSGRLIVRNRTQITTTPTSQDVVAGQDVVLHCDATTDDNEMSQLTIKWKKNGVPIDYEGEPSLSCNKLDNSLKIVGANVADSGSFTCVASNGLDSDEMTAEIVVKDRPDAPGDLGLITCEAQKATLAWDIMSANNDPITEFIVYYNTSFDEQNVFHEGARVHGGENTAIVRLTPWANYTFHVKARNSLGLSDPSDFTFSVCTTPPMEPYRNPEGVCTNSVQPDELVITWQKMPKIEHHGEDFRYNVSYKRTRDPDAIARHEIIEQWDTESWTVPNQPTFQEYEISVRARNARGPSPERTLEVRLGYSGEDEPSVTPTGFDLVKNTLTDSSAEFTWDPVDTSPAAINGHFRGYRIVYWKADDPDEKRMTNIIETAFDPCPSLRPAAAGRRKRQAANQVTGHVQDLWPYADIMAGILVLNGAKTGALSDPPLRFMTPEGLPGRVQGAKVTQRGSHHLRLQWLPPLEPNGIIVGYTIGYKDVYKVTELPQLGAMLPPTALSTKLKHLEPDTEYMIYIYAHTGKGMGIEHALLEESTLVATPPDKPGVNAPIYANNTATVSWDETADGEKTKNPGSDFYIRYREKGNDTWVTVKPNDDNDNSVNITGLADGKEYEIVVVAVSGHGANSQETPSDPYVFTAGPKKGAAIVDEDDHEGVTIARSGWFISLICLLILLLIIILIICLVRRNRGGKYPVHEKEKLRGRPDDPEDQLGEYNKQPYMPLETKSDDPDYVNQKPPGGGSMDKEDQPLPGSESDSLAEYEDTDPTKFNEDGSFIGAYAGDNAYKKPDTASPLSTFV